MAAQSMCSPWHPILVPCVDIFVTVAAPGMHDIHCLFQLFPSSLFLSRRVHNPPFLLPPAGLGQPSDIDKAESILDQEMKSCPNVCTLHTFTHTSAHTHTYTLTHSVCVCVSLIHSLTHLLTHTYPNVTPLSLFMQSVLFLYFKGRCELIQGRIDEVSSHISPFVMLPNTHCMTFS